MYLADLNIVKQTSNIGPFFIIPPKLGLYPEALRRHLGFKILNIERSVRVRRVCTDFYRNKNNSN